jgi:nucleoside phosphorylase
MLMALCRAVLTGRISTARVAVLTILDEEFAAVDEKLGPLREIGEGFYEPEDDSHDVVVVQAADRTNVAAEEAVSEILEAFRPEVIIVCGIGGGIEDQDGIAVGDVVVASYLHYSEFRKISEDGDDDRYLAYDQPSAMLRSRQIHPVKRAGAWKSRITASAPNVDHEPKILIGPVLAGEKVIGDPTHHEHQRALKRFTDAIAVDMESYGAGRALHYKRTRVDYNPLLIVIRGISDIVRKPADGTPDAQVAQQTQANNAQRRLWKSYACDVAAAFACAMVDRLVAREDLRAAVRQATTGS